MKEMNLILYLLDGLSTQKFQVILKQKFDYIYLVEYILKRKAKKS